MIVHVYGLDLALNQSGLSHLSGQWYQREFSLLELDHRTVQTHLPKDVCCGRSIWRTHMLLAEIKAMMGPHLSPGIVKLVVLETVSFGEKGMGGYLRSELHGAVKNWLHENQIPVLCINPIFLKRFITKNHLATKAQVIGNIQEILKQVGVLTAPIRTSDEADAIGLGFIGAAYLNREKPALRESKKVTEKMERWIEEYNAPSVLSTFKNRLMSL